MVARFHFLVVPLAIGTLATVISVATSATATASPTPTPVCGSFWEDGTVLRCQEDLEVFGTKHSDYYVNAYIRNGYLLLVVVPEASEEYAKTAFARVRCGANRKFPAKVFTFMKSHFQQKRRIKNGKKATLAKGFKVDDISCKEDCCKKSFGFKLFVKLCKSKGSCRSMKTQFLEVFSSGIGCSTPCRGNGSPLVTAVASPCPKCVCAANTSVLAPFGEASGCTTQTPSPSPTPSPTASATPTLSPTTTTTTTATATAMAMAT